MAGNPEGSAIVFHIGISTFVAETSMRKDHVSSNLITRYFSQFVDYGLNLAEEFERYQITILSEFMRMLIPMAMKATCIRIMTKPTSHSL